MSLPRGASRAKRSVDPRVAALARKMTKCYPLSMEVALLFAEVELAETVSREREPRRRASPADIEEPARPGRVKWLIAALGVTLVALATFSLARRERERYAQPARRLAAAMRDARERIPMESSPEPVRSLRQLTSLSTRIQEDSDGRIVQITGPSPEAVLLAYCTHEVDRLRPVELATTSPVGGTVRIGLYQDLSRLGQLYAIEIRQDQKSRRWVAGDGRKPVPGLVAGQLRLGHVRIPVEL